MTSDAPAPLAGRRVVDLSRHLPGPMITRLLRDLGARVTKVEEPRMGDPVRQAPPLVRGTSTLGALLLAGLESVALDLKQELAREVLLEMLEDADVLVESFRPGGMAKLGLDPAMLRERFPQLVICSVSGWGQDGPHASRAGHDLNYQAVGGSLAAATGMPAVQVADLVGAWSGVTSILAALLERERTEQGAWIDQGLLDAATHSAVTAWAAEGDGPRRVGEPHSLTGQIPCYALYETADGRQLSVGCLEPRFWHRLVEVVERPELKLRQYRGDEGTWRMARQLFASRTAAEWAELAAAHDLPIEPVLSPSEALRHPQNVARGVLVEVSDGTSRLGFPAKFDGRRPMARSARVPAPAGPTGDPEAIGGPAEDDGSGEVARVPGLGEHTEAIVGETGIDAGVGRRDLKKGGVGRQRSLKRWAMRAAGSALGKLRKRTAPDGE